MSLVSEDIFVEALEPRLSEPLWERALAIFRNCGPNLAFDVTNVLMYASDQGKEAQVLDILETHYREHLSRQHPEIRGRCTDAIGVNPTEVLLLNICSETLGLDPDRTFLMVRGTEDPKSSESSSSPSSA